MEACSTRNCAPQRWNTFWYFLTHSHVSSLVKRITLLGLFWGEWAISEVVLTSTTWYKASTPLHGLLMLCAAFKARKMRVVWHFSRTTYSRHVRVLCCVHCKRYFSWQTRRPDQLSCSLTVINLPPHPPQSPSWEKNIWKVLAQSRTEPMRWANWWLSRSRALRCQKHAKSTSTP